MKPVNFYDPLIGPALKSMRAATLKTKMDIKLLKGTYNVPVEDTYKRVDTLSKKLNSRLNEEIDKTYKTFYP